MQISLRVKLEVYWCVGIDVKTRVEKKHDDVIKWKHFPRYWPFVRGIHRWPVNSPHKGQWRWVLMFSFTCAWINGWVNNREAGDLRRHQARYDVIVMEIWPHCIAVVPHKCHGISNRRQVDYLTTMKSMLCINDPLWGYPTRDRSIPLTKARNAARVSMSWCHHEKGQEIE